MSKIKIPFNGTNYSVDKSVLSVAENTLKSHLSTVMNGTGSVIKLGDTFYNVDSEKLTNATDAFVSHLGTIAGEGSGVDINGIKYAIDSTKMSDTISGLHAMFNSIKSEVKELVAGLYKPGAIALYNEQGAEAVEDMLITSWEDLVANGNMVVTGGEVSIGTVTLESLEKNEYGFYFDAMYTAYGNGMVMGIVFHEDGSFDTYSNGSFVQSSPAGSTIYSADSVDLSSASMGVGTFLNGGTSLSLIGYTFEVTLTIPFSPAGDLILPNDGSITSLGIAFSGNIKITGIIIPDSVTTIGYQAFYDCDSLTSVVIGNGVTTIGEEAFSRCDSLNSVEMGDSVTTIGGAAFSNCDSLISMVIPDSVTSIGAGAFLDNDSLTSVVIPNSVTTINKNTFYQCYSLTSITIPDSVTSIGNNAFYRCNSLTSVTIPDSVTSIDSSAFSGCSGLTEIVVDEDNQYYCSIDGILYDKNISTLIRCPTRTNLTSVTIPDSVTHIGSSAFNNCSSLTSVTIPDSVTTIGNSAFYGCSSLTSVTIPDSVTTIGNGAFNLCEGLMNITIGNGVTRINNGTFSSCSSLTSITIPNSVTFIDSYAFSGCSKLNDIYFTGTESEWNAITKAYRWDSNAGSYTVHYNHTLG